MTEYEYAGPGNRIGGSECCICGYSIEWGSPLFHRGSGYRFHVHCLESHDPAVASVRNGADSDGVVAEAKRSGAVKADLEDWAFAALAKPAETPDLDACMDIIRKHS